MKKFGFGDRIIERVCEIIENHYNYEKTLKKEDALLKIADGLASMLNPFLPTAKLIVCGEKPEEVVKKLIILNKKGSKELYNKWKYKSHRDIIKAFFKFYNKLDVP